MIEFEIEFLICFKIPNRTVKKEHTKKLYKERKFNKNIKKPIHVSNSEKVYEEKLPDSDKILNANDWCHIEYCILDNVLPLVEINVVTWGTDTYVFVEDYCQTVSTEIIDDIVWINFSMRHKIAEFDHEQVIKFKNSPITFTFSQSQTKVKPANDIENWQKQFIVTKKSAGLNYLTGKWISELLEINSSLNVVKDENMKRGNHCRMNQVDNNIVKHSLKGLHMKEMIMNKIQNNQTTKDQQDQIKKHVKIEKSKKDSSGKKYNKNTNNESKPEPTTEEVTKLYLKSEELIAGKSVFVEQHLTGLNLKYVGIIAKSSQILTDEQNFIFLPLVVALKSIEDLPLKYLEKLNLKTIYAKYEFTNIINNTETEKFAVREKDISIENTSVYFLSDLEESRQVEGIRPSILKLQEALSTQMMVVKLFGEENRNEFQIHASLFGENVEDEFISSPGHEMFLYYKYRMKNAPVFLGSAYFKPIQLLNGFSLVESSSVLTSSTVSMLDPKCDREMLMREKWNNKERESLLQKVFSRGQIPESVLLEACTRITVSVSLLFTITNLLFKDQFLVPDIYNRIVIVFKNQKVAFNFFKKITDFNKTILSPLSELITYNHTIQKYKEEDYGSKPSLLEDSVRQYFNSILYDLEELSDGTNSKSLLGKIITGFFLDNEEECIMVLEGSRYLFSNISDMLTSLVLPEDGKVMFDSSLFFTQRLYHAFFPLMNIFYMQLNIPLNTLLQQECHYLAKNISDQSVQTLLRLDMLRRSPTIDSIATNQLFPSYKQLINFNLSFGVTVTNNGSQYNS